MPDRLEKIMTATETADVAQLAMIEAMRQIADTGKATNRILEAVQTEVKDVRERVIRIEASELATDVASAKAEIANLRSESTGARERLRARIEKLELRDAERNGGTKLADAFARYWPLMVMLIGAIVLVATGKVGA
jgi:hypothetical protein